MKRLIAITVGTSLFHSATWDELPKPVPGYEHWLLEDRKKSPEARAGDTPVRSRLGEALRECPPAEWLAGLPTRVRDEGLTLRPVMRFSAELATLLEWANLEADDDLRRLLAEAKVLVPADPTLDGGRYREPWVAAQHLVAILNRVAGAPVAQIAEIPGLSSTRPEKLIQDPRQGLPALVRRLLDWVEEHSADCTPALDLVVTGGYKLYGFLLADLTRHLAPSSVRLLYLHETAEAQDLVVLTRNTVSVGGKKAGRPFPQAAPGGRPW